MQAGTNAIGINLGESNYIGCKYRISKEPEILLPSLSGAVIFKCNNKFYQFNIKEAVFINNKWKLSEPGNFEAIADSVFIQNPSFLPRRLSTMDSFMKNAEIKDVQMMEVKEGQPPPPPPPAIKKKKKG